MKLVLDIWIGGKEQFAEIDINFNKCYIIILSYKLDSCHYLNQLHGDVSIFCPLSDRSNVTLFYV